MKGLETNINPQSINFNLKNPQCEVYESCPLKSKIKPCCYITGDKICGEYHKLLNKLNKSIRGKNQQKWQD